MEEAPKLHTEHKEDLKLSFRKVTEGDVKDFLALERTAIGNKTYSGVVDEEEALREFAENEVFLIYKNGQLVGNTQYKFVTPDHAYLGGLIVHPNFQGQGIAREAALFRLEQLKGVKRIDLVTHPENFKIINLYESLGFKIEKRVENYWGDGEPRLVLVKES